MDYLEKCWNETLSILEKSLNTVSYNSWILPLSPIEEDKEKDLLYVGFKEGMPRMLIENYKERLEKAAAEAFGRSLSVVFLSPDEQKARLNAAAKKEEKMLPPLDFYLNPRYTFNSFVIGNNNRFAHAAALAVAEAPETAHNPLFLYGGSGLGKTHLMHAICHFKQEHYPEKKLFYVSSEAFTNELIRAIREKETLKFKEKYRNVDVLLIDDIQFIEKTESTQQEIFHTFEALYASNKQIIISSDRPPKELATLESRLRSRFEMGLVADILPPDYETRVAILQKKADAEKIPLNNEITKVICSIAESIKNNIRELEGAFNRVVSYASLTDQEITVELAKTVLQDVFEEHNKEITPDIIKKEVCNYYHIKKADLESSKRNRELAYPRQIAMYLCREMTELSLPKIGEAFGGRDHTTAIHGIRKIEDELASGRSDLAEVLETLQNSILA